MRRMPKQHRGGESTENLPFMISGLYCTSVIDTGISSLNFVCLFDALGMFSRLEFVRVSGPTASFLFWNLVSTQTEQATKIGNPK